MAKRADEPVVLENVSIIDLDENGGSSVRLHEANVTLAAGEWLTVVGVNGSGKSTLARLLAGLQPDNLTGDIGRGFAGEGVSPIVLQQPKAQLFGETPREEVVFALEWRGVDKERIAELVERALNKVGLLAYADVTWDRLSGGQQQLAAFAASVACDTPLLVLDEVTAMLDDHNREIVRQTTRDLHKQGTAIVWVTQRLDELEPYTRVVAIGEGRVIFDGDAREFLYGIAEPGELEPPLSPCLRAGLRLPYLPAMAVELRRQGIWSDPLPMTAQEWGKVLGQVGDEEAKSAMR
ncbi:energy-coupling factor ABC transporter ATP-binding protein [Cohnella cholangitidis]|uniref:ABC transporter ATP-binding protein n=1 Tax=Cohnella cholangitidis TaxID=2598458 RepID=A0A7G5BSZ4_9BACL|nr:ABC transporter ATP-binding protein [Cohnella cholangitidis]QMV40078.1 ABC transporter ATP-binding protein [Cohnella cholangitidis]